MSELLKINVNDHTEKKNGLTYLTWAWAWAEALKADPAATWWAIDYTGEDGKTVPYMTINGTAMVKTVVQIKGIERECLLPVMDHRNKAIKEPDAFQVNTAIMRCMTKAISMHGLGLYIYAGEDLPEGEDKPADPIPESFRSSPTMGELEALPEDERDYIREMADWVTTAFKGDLDANMAAIRHVDGSNLDDTQKMALWSLLDSKTRSSFKKVQKSMREETTA